MLKTSGMHLGQSFIGGAWWPIREENVTQPLYNPGTGEVIAEAPLAGAADVYKAVTAAAAAEIAWRKITAPERGLLLDAIANRFAARREELTRLSVLNNGKLHSEAEMDVGDAIATYRYYADVARNLHTAVATGPVGDALTMYRCLQPVGVSALIVPWNYPLVTTAWKVAPALAAGCTLVLKPSEVTPLPELVLGDIVSEAGLPAGVLNIVPGAEAVGQALVADARVRKVSFTGSNAVGEQVMRNAAAHLQNLSLELGGKSPIVVFGDVDLDWAAQQIVSGIFMNAGQMCSATSRLIVANRVAKPLYAALRKATEGLHAGPGDDAGSTLGPLVSPRQYERVQHFLQIASAEGLHCLTGGHVVARAGFFVEPTIYTDVPSSSKLWREEIFGPVLTSSTFKDEDEAIALANDTDFGLAATVLSKDLVRGARVMAAIDAGAQWLNGYQLAPASGGWGGLKRSGIGRELGSEGIRAYQETKYLLVPNATPLN